MDPTSQCLLMSTQQNYVWKLGKKPGGFFVFFVHGNMMDLSSGNLTACRLPLQEYAAYAFI